MADFDLSKFLDSGKETAMSSDVGTEAFKAPEYYLQDNGRIVYHRNVDIFSAALTFLAMAQFTESSKERMQPQIENFSSTVEKTIGQYLADKNYGVVTTTSSKKTSRKTTALCQES